MATALTRVLTTPFPPQSDFDHLQKKVGDIDRKNQQEVQEVGRLILSRTSLAC